MADSIETWEDFRNLVDNPHLPDETKAHLIESVAAGRGPMMPAPTATLSGFSQEELDDLKGQYHVTDEQVKQYYQGKGKPFNEVVSDAQDAAEANKKNDKNISDSQNRLDDIEKSANKGDVGGSGVNNSNEILDQGAAALKYMSDFLPLYEKVGSSFKGGDQAKAVSEMKKIYVRYDEQRDIPFDKFVDESEKVKKTADTARDSSADMGNQLSGLFEHWSGKAAERAQNVYSEFDKDNKNNVVDKLNNISQNIEDTQASVAKAVRNKANTTMRIFHADDPKFGNGMLGGKSKGEWSDTIDIANGAEDGDTLRRAAQAWGVNIDQDNCSGSLTAETKQAIRKKAMQVVSNIFVKNIAADWADFMGLCDTTQKTVDDLWNKMTALTGDIPQDPFAPPKDESGSTPPGDKQGGNDGKDAPPDGGQGADPPMTGGDSTSTDPSRQGGQSGTGDQVQRPPTLPSDGPPGDGDTTDPSQSGQSSVTAPPDAKVPDLSHIGENVPDPLSGGGDGSSKIPEVESSTDPSSVSGLSGKGGSGAPPPSGGGGSSAGPDLSGGGGSSSVPRPKVPDLSHIGENVPNPLSGGGDGSSKIPTVSSTDPSSLGPDLSGKGGSGAPPPSGGGGSSSMPKPKVPDLSHIGENVPNPLSGGGDGSSKTPGAPDPSMSDPASGTGKDGVVKEVSLPDGATATISTPDDNGDELLTIHDPDGGTKQYQLDFDGNSPDDAGPPGAETIRPDEDGNMVVNDGNTTLTFGEPSDDGATPVTVDGGDGQSQHYWLASPDSEAAEASPFSLDDPSGIDLDTPDPMTGDPGPGGGGDLPGLSDPVTAPGPAGGDTGPSMDVGPSPGPSGYSAVAAEPAMPDGGPGQQGGAVGVGAQASGENGMPTQTNTAAAPGSSEAGRGGGAGMMPPMGGGAGGGRGGNSEHSQNKWALAGNLFDDTSADRLDRLHNFLEARPSKSKD